MKPKTVLMAAALVGMIAFASPVRADQSDPALDDLFSELSSLSDQAKASEIEAEIWKIWLQHDNEKINHLMALGQAALQLGNGTIALVAFSKVIEMDPDYAEGWNKRATVNFVLGRMTDSLSDIARTLKLEPRHFGALSGLGLVTKALGNRDAAIAAFTEALKINPAMVGAKVNLQYLLEHPPGDPI